VKPGPLAYHRAESADEAVALLGELGEDAKILAGGQSLVPLMNLRLAAPAHLIDITRAPELGAIRRVGGMIEIGAAVRQRDAGDDPELMVGCPLLAAVLPHVAHQEIRNAGTICGSVAHADPAAEIPAVAVALGAEMTVRGSDGERIVPASEFFHSHFETALAPDELLVSLRLPVAGPGSGAGFHELARRAGDYAIAGAAAMVELADGVITRAGVACLAVGTVPVRAIAAESMLVGSEPGDDTVAAAARAAAGELDPPDDLHGTAAFRRHAAEALLRRAIGDAVVRANGGPE
jgi:carbon-monoxide dehydrogenase medium subunit